MIAVNSSKHDSSCCALQSRAASEWHWGGEWSNTDVTNGTCRVHVLANRNVEARARSPTLYTGRLLTACLWRHAVSHVPRHRPCFVTYVRQRERRMDRATKQGWHRYSTPVSSPITTRECMYFLWGLKTKWKITVNDVLQCDNNK